MQQLDHTKWNTSQRSWVSPDRERASDMSQELLRAAKDGLPLRTMQAYLSLLQVHTLPLNILLESCLRTPYSILGLPSSVFVSDNNKRHFTDTLDAHDADAGTALISLLQLYDLPFPTPFKQTLRIALEQSEIPSGIAYCGRILSFLSSKMTEGQSKKEFVSEKEGKHVHDSLQDLNHPNEHVCGLTREREETVGPPLRLPVNGEEFCFHEVFRYITSLLGQLNRFILDKSRKNLEETPENSLIITDFSETCLNKDAVYDSTERCQTTCRERKVFTSTRTMQQAAGTGIIGTHSLLRILFIQLREVCFVGATHFTEICEERKGAYKILQHRRWINTVPTRARHVMLNAMRQYLQHSLGEVQGVLESVRVIVCQSDRCQERKKNISNDGLGNKAWRKMKASDINDDESKSSSGIDAKYGMYFTSGLLSMSTLSSVTTYRDRNSSSNNSNMSSPICVVVLLHDLLTGDVPPLSLLHFSTTSRTGLSSKRSVDVDRGKGESHNLLLRYLKEYLDKLAVLYLLSNKYDLKDLLHNQSLLSATRICLSLWNSMYQSSYKIRTGREKLSKRPVRHRLRKREREEDAMETEHREEVEEEDDQPIDEERHDPSNFIGRNRRVYKREKTRSRNRTVDAWLRECDDVGNEDTYADLEDFIV